MKQPTLFIRLLPALALAMALLGLAPLAQAQVVGTVTKVSGLMVAKSAEGRSRVLAENSALRQGDTISTGRNTFGRLEFVDGAAMEGKADVVLMLSHGRLPAGPGAAGAVPEAELIQWMETHSVPLPMGTDIEYVQQGGGLSVAPSAKSMGEVAAADALSWLKAKSAEPPPPASQDTRYSIAARATALRARNITLPSIYLEAARLEQLYYP